MNIKRLITTGASIVIIISSILLVCACSNSPPVIERISLENGQVGVSSTVEVQSEVSDPDSDELTYTWSTTGGDISAHSSAATWTVPDKPGSYSIILSVRDSQNNETVDQISVCVAANLAPVIDSLLIEPPAVGEGQQAIITCHAYDPEGDELQYQWQADDGDLSGSGAVANWTLPYDIPVTTIRVDVADQSGESATMAINVNILPNNQPDVVSLNANPRSLKPGATSNIACIAIDADGDKLEYSWEASGGVIDADGTQAVWTAPEDCGSYEIKVTASDGRRGEAMKTLKLTVAKTGG